MVASFPSFITDDLFSPFVGEGSRLRSNFPCHFSWLVIKATVTSDSVSRRINAGLFLSPVKSEKGNGIPAHKNGFNYKVNKI
jgi:hypothetical protein